MEIAFWLIAGIFIVIALLLIALPVWFSRQSSEMGASQQNLDIARQRYQDLRNQLRSGAISQTDFDDQEAELELTLNQDLQNTSQSSTTAVQGRWILVLIIPGLPVMAILLYLMIGDPAAIDRKVVSQAEMGRVPEAINTMVEKLAERLQQEPEDLEGWVMLGRSYKYMKKYQQSADAFAKAFQLQGDNADIMLQYADALTMAKPDKLLAGKPAELVFKALSKQPDHPTGLWLAGMAMAEEGDYQQALAYWQRLEPQIPAQSESYADLQKLISAARSRLNLPAQETTKVTSQVQLTVSINLADDIKDLVQANDTLFIYAQPLTGPRMPLAIIRKQAKDLPVTVTLSDAQAMSPMAKLSNHQQVRLLARISKTGGAMQQPGDLIGIIEPVAVNNTNKIDILIDKAVN